MFSKRKKKKTLKTCQTRNTSRYFLTLSYRTTELWTVNLTTRTVSQGKQACLQEKVVLPWCRLAPSLDVHSLLGSKMQLGAVLPSVGTVETNSRPGGLLLSRQGGGRKRRLGEHISEAQKPSDIAPDHTAFEHRGAESETRGTCPLPVTHGLRNQGKQTKEHFEATEATGAGPSGCSREAGQAGEADVLFRPDPSDQRGAGPQREVRIPSRDRYHRD